MLTPFVVWSKNLSGEEISLALHEFGMLSHPN